MIELVLGAAGLVIAAVVLMLAMPSAGQAATPSAGAATPSAGKAAALPAAPIPSMGAQPTYVGSPASPRAIKGVPSTRRNPFMAPNGLSEIHNDAWQTDAYAWSGPLGRSPRTSSTLLSRDCGSLTFDSRGRVISICVGLPGPQLYMFDPDTLDTRATFALPPRQSVPPGGSIFQDFTGGGYFYLDNRDRVVTSTTTRHVYVIAETPDGSGFTKVGDYDLSGVLTPTEKITSALPDSHGLLWFVARTDGVVGTLDFATGAIHMIRLGHGADGEIENSFAADVQPDDAGAAHRGEAGRRARRRPPGVYIATNRKLYRFVAGSGDVPKVSWQVRYPNSGQTKPGQVDDGTGTTPTVMGNGYVSITDNADPMDVVVYRTRVKLTRRVRRHHRWRRIHLRRQVCKVPVFSRGASATENSIVAAGRSMIVENNYGYTGPTTVENGGVTAPGFARVDVNKDGKGCRRVWTNKTESAPTVVSKLSLANGLVYTYTKGPGSSDPWYWTALDYRTGRTVYKQFSGTGVNYNNNYAGIALAPDGAEYLGTIGGLISMRDGS